MIDCNPAQTQYVSNMNLSQQHSIQAFTFERATKYRNILGKIRCTTDGTHPDLACTTNILAQHTPSPQQHYAQTLKCALRYLEGTQPYGLLYSPIDKLTDIVDFEVYTNADFANKTTKKSVSGNEHCMCNTSVS